MKRPGLSGSILSPDTYAFYIPFDEFNTLVYSNLVAKRIKQGNKGIKLATCAFKTFECLYSNFDHIITFDWPYFSSPIDGTAKNPQLRDVFLKESQKKFLEHNLDLPPSLSEVEKEISETFGNAIHKKVFGLLVEQLLNDGAMIRASSSEKKKANEYLHALGINGPYHLIIGRNREIHPHHNNLLNEQIIRSLSQGFTVINATFPAPKLQEEYRHSYFEVSESENTYGFTVALMELAEMNFVWGNAGGISVHMMTEVPITVVGPMNWVNSKRFAYKSKTLFQARIDSGIETLHTWRGVDKSLMVKSYLRGLVDSFSPNT